MSWRTEVVRGFAATLLALAAASGAHAAPKPKRQVQRVAVAQFDSPNSARARSAVLETLSDHNDVEVVSLDDINMAGKRLHVDPATPAGRSKLSEELGIGAWLDGKIDDDFAKFTLQAPDGRLLATASVQGHKASVLEGLAGQKIWAQMGALLSPRERTKRAIEAQQDLAMKKAQAREHQLAELRQGVRDRAANRIKELKVMQALALQKRQAFDAELERQASIVSDRKAVAEREQKAAEKKQTDAEERAFLASLQESNGPEADVAATSPSRTNVWTDNVNRTGNVWAASSKAPAEAARPAPVAPARPASNVAASPWMMTQGGSAQPTPAPRYAPEAPAQAGTNQQGVSPATRDWLERQGMH